MRKQERTQGDLTKQGSRTRTDAELLDSSFGLHHNPVLLVIMLPKLHVVHMMTTKLHRATPSADKGHKLQLRALISFY